MNQVQYKKKQGASNNEGVAYQIILLTALLYDAFKKTQERLYKSFNFYKNPHGKFVCILEYSYEPTTTTTTQRPFIIYLQTKYRQHGEVFIFLTPKETLNNNNEINTKKQKNTNVCLLNSYNNYKDLKTNFQKTRKDFKYVIYTNVPIRIKGYNNENVLTPSHEGDLLNCVREDGENNSNCFVIKSDFIQILVKKLSSLVGQAEEKELTGFVENIVFMSKQPDSQTVKEKCKDEIIKQYSISAEEMKSRFPLIEDKMQEWWKDQTESLNHTNTFIQDSLKVSFKFDVKNPYEHFTGRSGAFEDTFKHHFGESDIFQAIAVCGCGGIGKSEFVKEYIKRYGHHYHYNIIWIDAKQITQSFNKIASKLNIDQNLKQDDLMIQICDYFSKRKCLLVFDNVLNKEVFLKNIPLRNIQSKPFVIITSRDREWGKDVKRLDLNILDLPEAISLVCDALNITQSPEVETLAQTLNRYPLVLRQAIDYIKNTEKISISHFLQQHDNFKDEVLKSPLFSKDSECTNNSVYTTWNITINEIKDKEEGKLAIRLLYLMAYISPLNIEKSLFLKIDSEPNISRALRLLVKYSMINFDQKYSIHEVVQEVYRTKNNKEEEKEILGEALELFDENVAANHAMYVWKYAIKYDDLILCHSSLSWKIIELLINESRFRDGHTFGKEVLEILAPFSDSNVRDDYIKVRKFLAKILFYQSKYKDSSDEYISIKEMEIKYYGTEDERVFNTENNIILILRHQGHYEAALKEFKILLKKEMKLFGPENTVTLMTRDEIATINQHLGKYEEALNENKEIKKIKISKLESERMANKQSEIKYDESLLRTMDEIALIYNFLGMYVKSEKEFDEILRIKRKHLNENDPFLLRTINNLGVLYIRDSKYDEAYELFQSRLKKLQDAYSDATSSIIITVYNISLIYYHKGLLDEALSTCEDNLKNCIKLFGNGHLKTLQIAQLKGDILLKLGHCDEAMKIFQDIMDKAKVTTMETLQTENSIGCVNLAQKKFKKALVIFEKVYKAKVKHFKNKNHPEALKTLHHMGSVYKGRGKLYKALILFQHVYEKRRIYLRKEHWDTLETLKEIEEIKKVIKWHNYVIDFVRDYKCIFLFCIIIFSILFYSFTVIENI